MADGADRFQQISQLGSGGMGSVSKARDLQTGQTVAIKVLHEHLADDPKTVRRFEHEVAMARRANSDYSVKVLGFGWRGKRPYMVMEWIDGPSLKDLLARERRLPWERARAIARDIAAALQVAHRNGVTHRDVKPSNILMAPDGRAKLADFGIAKAHDLTSLTESGAMLGTLHYMAPEKKPDGRADFYSLGVVLYEALTGSVPFPGDPVEAPHLHRTAEPDLRRISDPNARQLVTWLLQKDPANRPHDAATLLAALQGSTPPPNLRDTGATNPPVRRPSFAVPILAGAGALAVAIGGLAGVLAFTGGTNGDDNGGGNGGATRPPATATLPPANATVIVPTPAAKEAYIIVVDSSVSMSESSAGRPKRDIAMDEAEAALRAAPSTAQAALWTFGSQSSSEADKCTDARKLAGLAAPGRIDVRGQLGAVRPVGSTPLTLTVRNAVNDAAGATGAKRIHVTVIADDRDKCGEELAPEIARLQQRGIDLQIDVIGLNLDRESTIQFAEAVSAGNIKGTFKELH